MGTTMKNWNRDKEQKKKALLDATKDLLEKNVYYDITTKEIAKKAGVSIALLYKYYPDGKISLIKGLADEEAKIMLQEYPIETGQMMLPEDIEDIREFIYKNTLFSIDIHRRNRNLNLALEMIYLANPEGGPYALDKYEMYNDEVANLFVKLVANHISGINIDTSFSKFIVQLVDATIHRHVSLFAVTDTDESLANMLTDMIIDLISVYKSDSPNIVL